MAAPSNADEFLDLVRKSELVDAAALDAWVRNLRPAGSNPYTPKMLADMLVCDSVLTVFQADQIRFGKWRRFSIGGHKVLEQIGSGRMGSVYLCEDSRFERAVAVKVLPTALAQDTTSVRRFWHEARSIAAIHHENVVTAYGVGEDNGLHYIVMEYVHGPSLQQIVETKGPLSPSRAAHYVGQAAAGLQQMQSRGLIHRDLEPANILVNRQGVVKIVDFGLACVVDDGSVVDPKCNLVVDGMLSPDYAALELAAGRDVDGRADIYSLGAVLYFCLTGRPPLLEGTVAQKLQWLQTRRPEPILSLRPETPPALAAIAERMLSADPADRFPSAKDVAEALRPWTRQPIAPPADDEMPRWSPAALKIIGRAGM